VCAVPPHPNVAYFGALLGLDARNRGLAGLVIDGAVRDVEDLERLGFPVFCAGTSPAPPKKEFSGANGISITLRGVRISPNDYLIADRDGVVVVSADILLETYNKAREIVAAETRICDRLGGGERLFDILGLQRPPGT
jgi:regulator of RNase E activity RraA